MRVILRKTPLKVYSNLNKEPKVENLANQLVVAHWLRMILEKRAALKPVNWKISTLFYTAIQVQCRALKIKFVT